MKVKIGLVGPADSLERILQASARYLDSVEFVSGVYKLKEESPEITRELAPTCDVILFSGVVPYRIAALANVTSKPLLYLPRLGMSLARPLWDMRQRGQSFDRISIDSFAEQDLQEVAEELGIRFSTVRMVEYGESASYEELADAHESFYRRGITDVALSGLRRTTELLEERGVPCHRVYPTLHTIRESVEKAIFIGQNNRLRAYQTAVFIFQLRSGTASASTAYDFLRVKNSFERILIDFANGIFGSLFPFGYNEYILFSTRGAAEEPNWMSALFSAAEREGLVFRGGLGYGTTAYNAEANARKALNRAGGSKESSLFSVDLDGEIRGPLSRTEPTRYKISESDAGILAVAEASGLSPAHVSKIRALVRSAGRNRFDVEEFAAGLEVSPRSARRILQGLIAAGAARIAAIESSSRAGRPRRLYEVTI